MFLYTVVSAEQILNPSEVTACTYQKTGSSFVQGTQQGEHFVVERLISTDPSMYLNPKYTPGGYL